MNGPFPNPLAPVAVGVQVWAVCRAIQSTTGLPCCSTRWTVENGEFRCGECGEKHRPEWGKLVQYTATLAGMKFSAFTTAAHDDPVEAWNAHQCPALHMPPLEHRPAWLAGLPSRAEAVQQGLRAEIILINVRMI